MFDKLAYSENNIIGLIILLIIYVNIKSKDKKMNTEGKLFLAILCSTALIMIFEILRVTVYGSSEYLMRETHIILTAIYFILNPIPYIAWFLYTDFYIYKSVRRLRKINFFATIPAGISIILTIFSIVNKGIFYIDENNIYHRGSLFWLNATLYYSYGVATYLLITANRKILRKRDYYTLLLFGLIPAVAGVFQILDTERSSLWLAVSVSSLIVYLNIQNAEIYQDYLTGLYNRRHLDMYLENIIHVQKKDQSILLIMMDINYFKKINDTYGHIEGDKALQHTANILMDSFRSEDFISRYAGDEFVIITKLKNNENKENIIKRLRRKFKEFNESPVLPYEISISLGYDIYNPELKMDADDFIIHVDKLMYKDKFLFKKQNNLPR